MIGDPGLKLSRLTYGLALTLMIGWLLWVGQSVLIPIIAALIAVYVLSSGAEAMGRVPPFGRVPVVWRRALVVLGFALAVVGLFTLVSRNLTLVVSALPRYEHNLDALVDRGASLLGLEDEPSWASLRQATFDQISTRALVGPALMSLQGIGSTLFLVVLYASFFMAERGAFTAKLITAAGSADDGARAMSLVHRINERIGGYLFVKTVLNVILGALSYVIMLLIGIEFALFWAVLIGFFNYIPYIGSAAGVAFPVLLSLAQFGSFLGAGAVLVALSAAQVLVGGYLEPRMMGQTFNLSPFVVVVALSVWGALWGLAGAILAVPMTASLVLVLAEINQTRPLAVMLSANGRV